jgi:hypothetical protein
MLALPRVSRDAGGLQLAVVLQQNGPVVRGSGEAMVPAPPDHDVMAKGAKASLEVPMPVHQLGESFRRDLYAAQDQRLTPPPPEPVAGLELNLTNGGSNPVVLHLGDGDSELSMNIEGPGVVRLAVPGAPTPAHLQPRTIRLRPGESYTLVIERLISGRSGNLQYHFLTEPGDYTLTMVLRIGAGGQAVLQSQTARLTVRRGDQ